jgi:gluconate 2-dehydrogenase gamma chain
MNDPLARRSFLKGAGVASTAAAGTLLGGLATEAAAQSLPAPPGAAPASAAAAAPPVTPLLILTETEAAFVTAVADTMIPADALTASGSDCGVVAYIDGQLASAWGGGARMYRGGPYLTGTPQQGYQLPLTPREYFVAGIEAANLWSLATYKLPFDQLDPTQRTEALQAMETGKAAFTRFDSRAFFDSLLDIVMEGFFSDPAYGGNRHMASWRMLGFPGLPAFYADKVAAYQGKRYVAEPKSIADFS